MHIWNNALKEIKIHMRDPRTLIFMLLFPIVLMLILGTALSGAFSQSVQVGDMSLLYKSGLKEPLAPYWDEFVRVLEREGIRVTEAEGGADGREQVENGSFTAYAEVDERGIRYYGNPRQPLESNIVEGMIASFADRVNLVGAVLGHAPGQAGPGPLDSVSGEARGIVVETGLDAERQPGSMDYYGLVMTTMIALYAAVSSSHLIRGETVRKTALRLSASPVSKMEIFTGKVLGCTVIHALFLLAVFLFSKFVFQTNWGDHTGIVLLVLLSEVILAISLGLLCGILFSEKGAVAILMIFIQIASMFGGAYFPVELAGESWMSALVHLSPLYWVNAGLMELIYNHETGKALVVTGVHVAAAVVLLGFSAVYMHRKEAI